MKYSAIILAAGSGVRTGLKTNKNLVDLCGKKIIDYSIETFRSDSCCGELILVVKETDLNLFEQIYSSIVDKIIIGGKTRYHSVKNGLKFIENSYVCIHDAARPVISREFLSFFVDNITKYRAITPGFPVIDTVHIVDNSFVKDTIDRSSLNFVYTPQCFERELLLEAHKNSEDFSISVTDDIGLVKKFTSVDPFIYLLEEPNIKFTKLSDLKLLEGFINENRTKY